MVDDEVRAVKLLLSGTVGALAWGWTAHIMDLDPTFGGLLFATCGWLAVGIVYVAVKLQ